jgi:hypothetical protein
MLGKREIAREKPVSLYNVARSLVLILLLCSQLHAKVNLMHIILKAVISLSNLESFFYDQFEDSFPEADKPQ